MGVELETPRLLLKPPTLADADWITKGLNNFAVAGNMLVPYPYTKPMATAWLERGWNKVPPHERRFGLHLKNGPGIGMAGFAAPRGEAILTYWLAEPHWGRGLMTEGLRAVLQWYFENTNAERILAGAFHFNDASLAIQHKFGFAEIGRSTVHSLARGADIEHIDTELTRDDFETFVARANKKASNMARARSEREPSKDVLDAAKRDILGLAG